MVTPTPAKKVAAKRAAPAKKAAPAADVGTSDATPLTAAVLAALNVKDTSENPPSDLDGRDPELLKKLYNGVVKARAFEDRMHAMYRSGDLLGSLLLGQLA